MEKEAIEESISDVPFIEKHNEWRKRLENIIIEMMEIKTPEGKRIHLPLSDLAVAFTECTKLLLNDPNIDKFTVSKPSRFASTKK